MAPIDQSTKQKRNRGTLRRLAGNANAGSLVFMPDIGGNAIYAVPLIEDLADVCSAYSMLMPQDFTTSSTTPSIEDLGRQFADDIINAQLSGPLHVLGFSFAGFLAYETSRQLALRGVAPDMVWIVDLWRYRPLTLSEFSRHPAYHVVNLAKYVLANWRRLLLGRPAPEVLSAYRVVRFDLRKHPESYRDIIRRNYASMLRYRPEPTAAPVTVLRAIGEIDRHSEHGLGWQDLVSGRFRNIDVPGDHLSMLRQPENAKFIADLIRSDLPGTTGPHGT